MAIVPGFEYDIFISYRHNDNRSGWVTEFVKALQEELAATIKEPVSVYFDSNPHDGLLETHNVDKSLEGKLKCLIFIPILSQTYCDRKSFAWQHEFMAFNKLSKEDQFGRDVKLGNGNVASRILPIKIHDLDADDKATIENEIGGVLRAIEFIYKEPGVNRPLKPNDDRSLNLIKSDYKNQVNKVANAVKEIISGIKNPISVKPSTTNYQPTTTAPKPKTKFILAGAIFLLLIIAGYFLYPKISPPGNDVILEKSIAVLPFENMSGDPDQEYFSDGITEEILNSLAQLEGLKVTGRASSFQFKGKDIDLKEVGKKLSVTSILQGSVRKQNDQLRIIIQLVNASDGYQLWSQRFDRKMTDVFAIQDEIAQAVSLKLKITLLSHDTNASSKPTNQESYELYLKGKFFLNKRGPGLMKGLEYFKQSIALDSTFSQSYASIALSYGIMAFYYMVPSSDAIKQVKEYANKAIELNPNSSDAYLSLGFNAQYFERDWDGAKRLLEKSLLLNPNNMRARLQYAYYLEFIAGNYQAAAEEIKKAIQIDPLDFLPYINLARVYGRMGKDDKATEFFQKAFELNNSSSLPYTERASFLVNRKRTNEAIKTIEDGMSAIGRTQSMLALLAEAMAAAGQKEDAIKVYHEVKEMASKEYVAPIILGRVSAANGKLDEAFQWYDLAFREKNSGWVTWRTLLHPAAVKNDPRYQKIIEQLNYPD